MRPADGDGHMPEAQDTVGYSYRDGIVRIAVDHPPVNALARPVREGLHAALDRAAAEDGAQAVLLVGTARGFPAGEDLAELDAPLSGPSVADLCARIEAFGIPVIAALHGTVMGGGLELALAAHYRIALTSTRVGLPQVRLGLVPGAGATQRVPRMIGARAALEMMLGGGAYPVDRAPARGLVDVLADVDLNAAAEGYIRELLASGNGPRRTSELRDGFADPGAYQQDIARFREALANRPEIAPREILAAVEAAMLLPFEAGLALERDAFETCLGSEQSRALRAGFRAEHAAQGLGLPAGTALPDLSCIAVLGGGGLAAQLAFALLRAGVRVQWGTQDPDQLRAGVPKLRDAFEAGVVRGALTEDEAEECMALLRVGDGAAMTDGAQMILHAAPGQWNVPVPEGAVRAIAFAGEVEGLGLRFAPPVHATRLLEVIAGPSVTAGELAASRALARRLGRIAVRVSSSGESAAARLVAVCQRAADALVDLGQDPYDLDRALRDWGWTRPPFVARDLAGLAGHAQAPRADGAMNWSRLLRDAGRSGRAAGQGVYDWQSGSPREDDEVAALIDSARPRSAPLPPETIRGGLFGAMANAGARMLSEGMLSTPSEVDLVAVQALDLPRWRGGPMHLAGVEGLLRLRRTMETFDHPDRTLWTPEPVFAELIKNGRSFDALNG